MPAELLLLRAHLAHPPGVHGHHGLATADFDFHETRRFKFLHSLWTSVELLHTWMSV